MAPELVVGFVGFVSNNGLVEVGGNVASVNKTAEVKTKDEIISKIKAKSNELRALIDLHVPHSEEKRHTKDLIEAIADWAIREISKESGSSGS